MNKPNLQDHIAAIATKADALHKELGRSMHVQPHVQRAIDELFAEIRLAKSDVDTARQSEAEHSE